MWTISQELVSHKKKQAKSKIKEHFPLVLVTKLNFPNTKIHVKYFTILELHI